MKKCTSVCSGITRIFCNIGSDDLGVYTCVECRYELTEAAIKQQYKARFGNDWENHWFRLKDFRSKIRAENRYFRKRGYTMVEAIYTLKPLNVHEHRTFIHREIASMQRIEEEMRKYINGEIPMEPLGATVLPVLPHHLK